MQIVEHSFIVHIPPAALQRTTVGVANGMANGVVRLAGSKNYELDEQSKFSFSRTKACVLKSPKRQTFGSKKVQVSTRDVSRASSMQPSMSFNLHPRSNSVQAPWLADDKLPLAIGMHAFQSSLL